MTGSEKLPTMADVDAAKVGREEVETIAVDESSTDPARELSLLEEQGLQAVTGNAVQLAMQVHAFPLELLDAAVSGMESQMRREKVKGAHELQLLGYEEKVQMIKAVRHMRKRLDEVQQSLQARAALLTPMPPDA